MIRSCHVCAECKPRFHKPDPAHFERLNVDFKGPLASNNNNRYFLTVIDEYSRFPFIFPCANMTTTTVIKCFCGLFSMFGMPAYIHSDRGAAFMSTELRNFLHQKGIATSRTTPYNPQGNGQSERYNGTVWRAITLVLKTKRLPTSRWQEVLPDALHSILSLLCTTTNATPHERMFSFTRRSTVGRSIPTWLMTPGTVLFKRHV